MRLTLLLLILLACNHFPLRKSQPYLGRSQELPGILECEWYDTGGEGVAYHDSDTVNNGSGKLNPANGDSLNEFRMGEGVDISYTKGHGIDENPFNKVKRDTGRLYVGWTQPGEWIRYSITVKETGNYRLSLLYTANGEGQVDLDIDDIPTNMKWNIGSTHDDRDTVAWRQWHHWNIQQSPHTIHLDKGNHVLTLHTIAHGEMNFDHIEFVKQDN